MSAVLLHDSIVVLPQELAAALADGRGTLHPLVADVSREDEVRRVYQWIDDNLGGVTVVVNNAAVLSLQPVQGKKSPSLGVL